MKTGERVTGVYGAGALLTRNGHVARPTDSGVFERFHINCTDGKGRIAVGPYYNEREGITWIRGHHTPNSLEGSALLSAYALCSSTP